MGPQRWRLFGLIVEAQNGEKVGLTLGWIYAPPSMTGKEAIVARKGDEDLRPSLWVSRLRPASNAAVSIAILAAIAFLLWQQRASEITPVLIGCAIVLFVINLGRFTKFKYGSAELEAVTDARKATEEAYATIAQLRELSAKVAKVALALLPGDGRLGGLGDFARLELKQEVVETLTRIGLSAEQLRDAADVFDEFYASLHAFNVVRVFWISHEGSRDKETGLLFGYRDYNRLAKRFVNYSNRHRTPPRELRKQLAEIAPLSPPVEEALEDYEYFLKEKKFKRQADWE